MSKTETIEKTENKEAVAKWLALPKGAYSGLLKYEINYRLIRLYLKS